MFETEEELAEEYVRQNCDDSLNSFRGQELKEAYITGYNKANEWHYMKDGLPTKSGRYLICNLIKTKRKKYILTNIAEFDSRYEIFGGIDNSTIYAWKEIVLPELKEIE